MNNAPNDAVAWADRAILDSSLELIDLAAELVRIPSENPPGDTREVCDFCEDWLRGRGVDVRRIAADPSMPNLIAPVAGGGGGGGGRPGRRLVLNAHIDTFPAGDARLWKHPPFGGEIEGGRLYGRGAVDMKGSVAAVLLITALAAKNPEKFTGELVLTLASDEETMGEKGSAHLLAEASEGRGDAMLSPENSGSRTLCFGQKGLFWVRVAARGRGAHGAFVHRGKSAVDALLVVLTEVRKRLGMIGPVLPLELEHYFEAAREDPRNLWVEEDREILRAVTANVGRISGGDKVNLVAEACAAELDIRVPPGLPTDRVRNILDEVLAAHPDVEWEELRAFDSTVSEPDSPLFRVLRDEIERVMGEEPVMALRIGATDARLFRAAGVPSATYGPTGRNIGGPNEYVDLEELTQVARVLARTSFSFLDGR